MERAKPIGAGATRQLLTERRSEDFTERVGFGSSSSGGASVKSIRLMLLLHG